MKSAYFVSYTYKRYGQEHASFRQLVIVGRHPFEWLKDYELYKSIAIVTIISFQKITLAEWTNFPGEKWHGSKKISKEDE